MKISCLVAGAAVLVLGACAPVPIKPVTTRNSELTHGNVQLNLKLGETSQTEVLEVFGAPNITSIDGTGQEVWTYQRSATVSQSTSSKGFWTVLLTGEAGLLGGQSQEASGLEQTQRTMTLIIKFDDKKHVSDFRSRSSEF
jgi:outer membrane protein assembly factor BamE (lipoprotein component of BamABCDE complex)